MIALHSWPLQLNFLFCLFKEETRCDRKNPVVLSKPSTLVSLSIGFPIWIKGIGSASYDLQGCYNNH
jgi:hypothetical protein